MGNSDQLDLYSKRDFFFINSNIRKEKVTSLQDVCRNTIINSVSLDRAQTIRKLPLPNILKEQVCSFGIPQDFDLDGFYIDYHCNFPNHVHHKNHQIHPGKCLIDGSKVLIKSQSLNERCRTCETVGKCKMASLEDRTLWSKLKHSNLMKCRISMEDPRAQRVCLVFEFPGITLQDFIFRMFIAKKQIPELISWQILQKLSTVLIYLENNGLLPWELCHPQNVILTPEGEIKLENLLLYLPTEAGARYQTNSAKLLSPEQMEGEPVTSKTLVWWLGCILYEVNSKNASPNSPCGNNTSPSPLISYQQAVSSTKEMSRVMCECLRSSPGSRPSMPSLEEQARSQVDNRKLGDWTENSPLLDLMKGIERLPFLGELHVFK